MVTQSNFSVEEYFLKVKNLCSEISELDAKELVSDSRLWHYLIVDYEKTLCPLFSQYKDVQINLQLLNC